MKSRNSPVGRSFRCKATIRDEFGHVNISAFHVGRLSHTRITQFRPNADMPRGMSREAFSMTAYGTQEMHFGAKIKETGWAPRHKEHGARASRSFDCGSAVYSQFPDILVQFMNGKASGLQAIQATTDVLYMARTLAMMSTAR